jgi:uncharacterized cupin superfamily protein
MSGDAFDLVTTYVHLGRGATAIPLPDFSWQPQRVMEYLKRFAADRTDGRLVGVVPADRSWSRWERHVEGDELVVQLTGVSDVVQEIDGEHRAIQLKPGCAVINPRGVWHTSDVHEPGQTLFIAGGRRTEYRPRVGATAPTRA